MRDVEDFSKVFQNLNYNDSMLQRIQECQHALGGKTFYERLLELLKIKGRKIYPPKTPQQLHDLHQKIVTAETSLHNKHCLVLYILKDLSSLYQGEGNLASTFAGDVHIDYRFRTFIEGLWALDHLEFAHAVGHLTHPSIVPTFPDEIIHTLLKAKEKLSSVGRQSTPQDDMLPLAYYNCVKPPLDDVKVRNEFAKYLSARNVTETYQWIHDRPEYEQATLLEILIEQTLHKSHSATEVYPREDRAIELISLPFSDEEESFIEKFLTEGKGRTLDGAHDTVMMRKLASGKLVDVAKDSSAKGKRVDGVNWDVLKDGILKGLGPRGKEKEFVMS